MIKHLVSAVAAMVVAAPAFSGVIYQQDFENNSNGFTSPPVHGARVPTQGGYVTGSQGFSNHGFGDQLWQSDTPTTLTLRTTAVSNATLSLRLAILDTWDGGEGGDAADRFRITLDGATVLFDEIFANYSGRSDRSGFFRDELAQLLVWSQREGLDPAEVRGSYAGAIGLPQFMPGSINRYAVDFDGDGHIDLINSTADAIGSVAHYLHSHGWQPGLPTHFSVAPPEDRVGRATLLAPDILPSFTPAQFAEHGAALERAARELPGPLALVELFNGDAPPSYVAGTQNFYAVTRYNWSSYYALAVIELGQAVAAGR